MLHISWWRAVSDLSSHQMLEKEPSGGCAGQTEEATFRYH